MITGKEKSLPSVSEEDAINMEREHRIFILQGKNGYKIVFRSINISTKRYQVPSIA